MADVIVKKLKYLFCIADRAQSERPKIAKSYITLGASFHLLFSLSALYFWLCTESTTYTAAAHSQKPLFQTVVYTATMPFSLLFPALFFKSLSKAVLLPNTLLFLYILEILCHWLLLKSSSMPLHFFCLGRLSKLFTFLGGWKASSV